MFNLRSRFAAIVAILICSGTLMFIDGLLRPARALTLCTMTFGLFGCASYDPSGEPSFYKTMAVPGAVLDAKTAASMISGYRRNNGLGMVTLDDALMRAAEE